MARTRSTAWKPLAPSYGRCLDQSDEYTIICSTAQLTHTSEPTVRQKLKTAELSRFEFGSRTLIRVADLLSLVRGAA